MTRPLPKPTPETRPFWDAVQRGEWMLPHCADTGACFFPPRAVSPFTGGDVVWRPGSRQGVLTSFVIPETPGPGFEHRLRYAIALATLDEGVLFVAPIAGGTAASLYPRLGDRLEVIFEDSDGFRLPAFRMVGGVA